MEVDVKFGALFVTYLVIMFVNLGLWPVAESLGWDKLGLQAAYLSGFGAIATGTAAIHKGIRLAMRNYYNLYVIGATILVVISTSIYGFHLKPLFPA